MRRIVTISACLIVLNLTGCSGSFVRPGWVPYNRSVAGTVTTTDAAADTVPVFDARVKVIEFDTSEARNLNEYNLDPDTGLPRNLNFQAYTADTDENGEYSLRIRFAAGKRYFVKVAKTGYSMEGGEPENLNLKEITQSLKLGNPTSSFDPQLTLQSSGG